MSRKRDFDSINTTNTDNKEPEEKKQKTISGRFQEVLAEKGIFLGQLIQTDTEGSYPIHKIARLKDPEILHHFIQKMLEEDEEADLNPNTIVSQITGSSYDTLSILKKPNPSERKLRVSQAAAYNPKCEKILRTQIALQSLKILEEEDVVPILNRLVGLDYDLDDLNYEELKKLRDSKLEKLEVFSLPYMEDICQNMSISLAQRLAKQPGTSVTNVENIVKLAESYLNSKKTGNEK